MSRKQLEADREREIVKLDIARAHGDFQRVLNHAKLILEFELGLASEDASDRRTANLVGRRTVRG